MSKGKEHKKYEFGAKASVVVGKNSGVILGAYSLPKNDYDGHALEPTLAQVERVSGYRPAVAIGDKSRRHLNCQPRAWCLICIVRISDSTFTYSKVIKAIIDQCHTIT